MNLRNFWKEIERPIIALSPMDGVTDACFRRIVARHGRPDLIVTEFTSVEGICHGAESELSGLVYDEIERPVVAQIYGADPESFYHVAQLVCELGFDGLDINMGCPAKAVSSRGCGAGLIRDPGRAAAILEATRRGIRRWADGAPLSIFSVHPSIEAWFRNRKPYLPPLPERSPIPISVKTRLGTDRIVIKEWVGHLLESRPSAISIHGRTLKQGYSGSANWEAIAGAVEIAKGSGTLILGNGDLTSLGDAYQKVLETGVDGVLIGRAALGNPWLFRHKKAIWDGVPSEAGRPNSEPTVPISERLQVALEHARLFEEMRGVSRFAGMRKHLGWYCKGFRGAGELRSKMVQVRNAEQVEALLASYFSELSCR